MANGEYLEVIAFLPKRDGGKRAQRCGRAKVKEDGSVQLWLDVVPTAGWDGSLLCSQPREQGQQQQQTRSPQPTARSGGYTPPRPAQPPAADNFDDDSVPF